MLYQAFACADVPSNMVVGFRCVSRPILAAKFDMGCTDYWILVGNFGKLDQEWCSLCHPVVMQVATLLRCGCRSTSFAASCQQMQASLRF